MAVGILLVTHEGIGSAILAVATRLLRQLPLDELPAIAAAGARNGVIHDDG